MSNRCSGICYHGTYKHKSHCTCTARVYERTKPQTMGTSRAAKQKSVPQHILFVVRDRNYRSRTSSTWPPTHPCLQQHTHRCYRRQPQRWLACSTAHARVPATSKLASVLWRIYPPFGASTHSYLYCLILSRQERLHSCQAAAKLLSASSMRRPSLCLRVSCVSCMLSCRPARQPRLLCGWPV